MASANTPSPGQPISINDIKRVFGSGLNLTPGDDLNDYHGIGYWDTTYPYAAGKFNVTLGTQLTLQDFYSKSSIDPVIAGYIADDTPGNKFYIIPPFRTKIRIEIWGGGGGGGSGDRDNKQAGSSGTASSVSINAVPINITLSATGGGGGLGATRNQSAGGGGGGTTSSSGSFAELTTISINGSSGGSGDAGAGRGGAGGTAPAGGLGGAGGYGRGIRYGMVGNIPGAGGGGGGWSDYQSGKNANPNNHGAGGGGSGAYFKVDIPRSKIAPGTVVNYIVGSGGAGGLAWSHGGDGANGRFKISWDPSS